MDDPTIVALTAGAFVTGTIDEYSFGGASTDIDLYQMTLIMGHRYTFTAVAGSGSLDQVVIRLLLGGSSLSPDIFAQGSTPSFTFDAPFGGLYTSMGAGAGNLLAYGLSVRAGGSGAVQDKIGNFSLGFVDNGAYLPIPDTVPDNSATTATLPVGGTVSGVIDQDNLNGEVLDNDLYRMILVGGHRYTFSANANVSTPTHSTSYLFG